MVAWISLLVAIGMLLWPLDPSVSLMDMIGSFGGGIKPFPVGPVNALDALFSPGDMGATAAWRLVLASILALLTIGIEFALRSRTRVSETTRPSMKDLTRFSGP